MSGTWGTLFKYNICLIFAVLLTIGLGNSFGSLPALGPLLSPYTGFWRNTPIKLSTHEEFDWSSLSAKVDVYWDAHRVPHIFGETLLDVVQVQGFVHARDRLFQMDLSTRAPVGRLSELVGDKALKVDRFFVSVGMREAVESAYQQAMADPDVRGLLEAYSEGVNRHIHSLGKATYPIEYKLLGNSPEPWTPVKSIQLVKAMSFRLAGRSYDLMATKHLKKIGLEKTLGLFPQKLPKKWFAGFESGAGYQPADFKSSTPFLTALESFPDYLQPFATNGSNNWAVSSSLSKDGHSYLANDTHLSYSSPSIWYEQQLVASKDEINMYGASILAAPLMEIGFSPNFGWGVTNGNTDVVDWYEVEFKSDESLEYLWNGEWVEAEAKTEEIQVKGSEPVELKLISTKAGLIVHREARLGLALRWLALETGNDLKAFVELTRSKNRGECLAAGKILDVPAQNIVCADPDGVAIQHSGKIPIRPFGDGQFVKDGRSSKSSWKGYIPKENLPRSVDPQSGFVFSANADVATRKYPYFVSWDFASPFRAMRIRQLLGKLKPGNVSLDKFKSMQTDEFDLKASRLLPNMLKLLGDSSVVPKGLKEWDFLATSASVAASIYYSWEDRFRRALFEPALGPRKQNLHPRPEILVDLLEALVNDDKTNPNLWLLGESPKSYVKDRLASSLKEALKSLQSRFGSDSSKWLWGQVQVTHMDHLLKISAFGKQITNAGGALEAINANMGKHGASWRQVVKIGKEFEAYTNYPGGQSGNPFDPAYHSYVESWASGEYRKVNFYNTREDAAQALKGRQ